MWTNAAPLPKGKEDHLRTFPTRLSILIVVVCVSWLGCNSASESESESKGVTEPEHTAEATSGNRSEPADPTSFPDVVATVNGVDIGKEELMERAGSVEAREPAGMDTTSLDFYHRVLNELIGSELLYRASEADGLRATQAQVDSQVDALRGRFPQPELFDQALAAEGLTLEGIRTRMQRDLSIQKLVESRIAGRVSVTDADTRAYYVDNAEHMRQPDRLRLRHILKRVDASAPAGERETARGAIDGLHTQVAGGADFAVLAREHSEDPGSAPNGGELVISRGQTVPAFEEAAFDLEPGGLSPVVETRFGFHIIQLTEKLPGEVIPFDVAAPRIEEVLRSQALQQEVEREVESLRSAAQIRVFL
jgi:peptidyl-prolyl cis-trans isomerase C